KSREEGLFGQKPHQAPGLALHALWQSKLRGVPHLYRLIMAGRGQALAVGAEGHARDPAGVPREGEGLLAAGGIPHLHLPRSAGRLVSTAGQALAVGAEGHARPRGTALPTATDVAGPRPGPG